MTLSSTAGAGSGGGTQDQEERCFEVVATVLGIFGRMNSLASFALIYKLATDGSSNATYMHV